MLHQREQTGYRAAGTRTQTGRRGARFSRIRTRGRGSQGTVVLASGTGAGRRYDYHVGGFKTCQKHKAVMRDYRRNQSKAAVPCHCWQYHDGLPQRTRRPDDRSLFTNGRRVQPTRTCDDTRARALWNGERQSQGREDRQTGADRRRYTACFSSPLSRVPK